MKTLFVMLVVLLILIPTGVSGDLEYVSIVAYVWDSDLQPVYDAEVVFDFFFYTEQPTSINGNYYYYQGEAFDLVTICVDGVCSETRATEEMMAENIIVYKHFLPDIRR